jgi:hypothetical protein
MVIVGIDPGAKGSLCSLDTVSKSIWFIPTTALPHELYAWLKRDDSIHMIGIEDVHAIYGTSAGSNFKFGFNVGLLHGIIGATQIGMDLVPPKVWQKETGIRFKKGMTSAMKKKTVAAKALQLYPKAQLHGPKGGLLDGRSDALMIAHYLALKYGGN